MNLRIPYGPAGRKPDFDTILNGVFETDQFDDWLPDPVFHQDRRSDRAPLLDRLALIWQSSNVETEGLVPLTLPRAGAHTLVAMALPIELRCIAHAVIADFAENVQKTLIADKVRGFRFQPAAAAAPFSPPGYEMEELGALVINAAIVESAKVVQVVDVVDFSQSATSRKLAEVLIAAGADNAQALFLHRLLELRSTGLPSIDDAFSFAYNFFLRPVDDALAAQQVNFFRYRDEYFVLSQEAVTAVQQELARIGLRGAVMSVETVQSVLKDSLRERWSAEFDPAEPEGPGELREELAHLGDGVVVAYYECETLAEELGRCQTDKVQIEFERDPGGSLDRVFAEAAGGGILDSVDLVPVLAHHNTIRATALAFVAPFDNVPAAHREMSGRLVERLPALKAALAAGLQPGGAPWQAYWSAGLISDAGPLDAEGRQLLQSALHASLPLEFEWQMRTTLARASNLDATAIWSDRPADASPFVTRATALAAYYLAKRGSNGPWKALKADAAFSDRGLLNWLEANL